MCFDLLIGVIHDENGFGNAALDLREMEDADFNALKEVISDPINMTFYPSLMMMGSKGGLIGARIAIPNMVLVFGRFSIKECSEYI